MKTTMKIFPLMLGIMLFFTQCEKEAIDKGTNAQEAFDFGLKDYTDYDCNNEQELWAGAGQNILENGVLVGSVKWGIDGTNLKVKYVIDDEDWSLTETHLWVGDDIDDIPKNAAPGRFPNQGYHNFESEVEYEIDISDFTPGETLYLAAHAVVAYLEGVEGVYELILPETINFKVQFLASTPGAISYFNTEILDGELQGFYEGWCLDSYTDIDTGNDLVGSIYSSYGDHEELFEELFDMPENLPLINWIINYDFVGKESLGGYGTYTLGDVQKAIWILLEEVPNPNPTGGVGLYNVDRVDEIVAMAYENGEDYVPGCEDYVVIIIVKPGQQTTMFKYPVPCGYDETAWALGGVEGTHDDYTFIENDIANKWGWFFDITCY